MPWAALKQPAAACKQQEAKFENMLGPTSCESDGSSHSECSFRDLQQDCLSADLAAIRGMVEDLLVDSERLDRMSPVEHLRWAEGLPVRKWR